MRGNKYQKLAQQILESKLGFRPACTDLVIWESGEHTDKDNGQTIIDYIAFGRYGFNRVEYRAHYAAYDWDLQIVDTQTKDDMYI